MTYLVTNPWTRVNETWTDPNINCVPVTQTYCDLLIQGQANSTRFQVEFYKHIAVDIVTETVYNYPYPHVTEKTLRPISCKRMFILVAPPGTLKLLHSKGFKTFADVIDERYDDEIDPICRWHMICQSIKEFVIKPLDEIHNIVQHYQDTLENNFQILINLEKIECRKIYDPNS